MSNVRQTSVEAYFEVLPKLGNRQFEVMMALYTKPATDKEIAEKLNRPINTVTPRRNELVKQGIVEEKERRECSITGHRAIAWGIVDGLEGKIEEELKSDRQKKAEEEEMEIEQIEPFLFKVKDEYIVDIDDKTCTCPDYQYRQVKCKHIYKVEMYLEAE